MKPIVTKSISDSVDSDKARKIREISVEQIGKKKQCSHFDDDGKETKSTGIEGEAWALSLFYKTTIACTLLYV